MVYKVNISKLDAAKRQLTLAIKMFFYDSDIVATHTLACAAFHLLQDLANKQGIKSIHNKLLDSVRPEFKREVNIRIRKPANFFKHADLEKPDAILEFNPLLNENFLFDAALLYKELTSESDPIISGFGAWYYMKYPHSLIDSPAKVEIMKNIEKFNLNNKIEFYQILIQNEIKTLK